MNDFNTLTYIACHGAMGLTPAEKEADWPSLCRMALEQRVSALVYLALQKNRCSCPDEVYSRLESMALGQMLRSDLKQEKTKWLLSQMYEQGITVAIMKGSGIGECYADPLSRVSSDVDLLVKPSDRDRAFDFLSEHLQCVDKNKTSGHYGIFADPVLRAVELHDRFENRESVEEMFDGCRLLFEKVKYLDCGDHYEIDYTQHFNFICHHIVRHFIKGGISLQMLIDVVMFYRKHGDAIDMDQVRAELERMGCVRFFDAVNGLFLRCGIEMGLPFGSADEEKVADLAEDLILGKGNMTVEGSDHKIRIKQSGMVSGSVWQKLKKYMSIIKGCFFPYSGKIRAMGRPFVVGYFRHVGLYFRRYYDLAKADADIGEMNRRRKLLRELDLL